MEKAILKVFLINNQIGLTIVDPKMFGSISGVFDPDIYKGCDDVIMTINCHYNVTHMPYLDQVT